MLEASLLLALLCSGVWLGAIVFLSFVLAPVVFKVLSERGASHLLRAVFPRYYLLGIGCAAVLHVSLIAKITLAGEMITAELWSMLGSAMMLLMSIYSLLLIPKINRARDAGQSMAKVFENLHQRSVIINVLNLLITLAVLINLAIALIYLRL